MMQSHHSKTMTNTQVLLIIGMCLAFMSYLIYLGVQDGTKVDTRTIDQVQQQRFKECISNSSANTVPRCENFLTVTTTNHA